MYISGKYYDFSNFEDDDYAARYWDSNFNFYFDGYWEDCDNEEKEDVEDEDNGILFNENEEDWYEEKLGASGKSYLTKGYGCDGLDPDDLDGFYFENSDGTYYDGLYSDTKHNRKKDSQSDIHTPSIPEPPRNNSVTQAAISKDDKSFVYHFLEGPAVTIESGKDGVTDEMIKIVHSFYTEEYRDGRKIFNHTDLRFENYRKMTQGTDKETINDFIDPITNIPSSDGFEYTEYLKEACDYVMENIYPLLTENQQELFLKVYHERITQTAIAKDDGVTRQAVNNRLSKIKRRIVKELPPEMAEAICERFDILNPQKSEKYTKKRK